MIVVDTMSDSEVHQRRFSTVPFLLRACNWSFGGAGRSVLLHVVEVLVSYFSRSLNQEMTSVYRWNVNGNSVAQT